MGNVLKVKDKKTNKWIDIPAIQGRSAYEAAVDGGFEGTEEEFAKALTGVALDGEHITNTNNPHKVTADQIDALPITGGTINGGLNVNDWLTANILSMNPEYYHEPIEIGQYIDFHKKGSRNDFDVRLGIIDDNLKLYLKNVGIFDLYSTHNKPTAADVGALSKTIFIDNKDILGIVDDGWYYGRGMSNIPTSVNSGYIRVMTMQGDTKYRVVYWRPHNSSIEYTNVLNNGTWLGWTETFTNQSSVLRKSLSIQSDNPHVTLANNNENYASLYKHAVADEYDYGTLIRDSSERLNTDNYLDLRVQHNQAKNGNKNGCLSLYYRQNGAGTEYKIFGEHNKPTATYNGLGSAQTINVGGVGNILVIWYGATSSRTITFVTPVGAFSVIIYSSGSTLVTSRSNDVTYVNGVLKISTTADAVNQSGVTYYYQVL